MILIDGPFFDAWNENNWLVSLGRGVYDQIMNDFIACTFVGLSTVFVEEIIQRAFYSMVDYGSVWDPVKVQEACESFAAHADDFFVAA